MAAPTAILDACVLYPAQVRSLFMHLAAGGLFHPRWTDAIHEEWMRSLLRDRPDLTRAKAERVRDLINAHVLDCLVTGYEDLIPTLALPDPDDCHVLAAAIRCGATALVTFNLSDFPQDRLTPHNVEAVHPDEFVVRLLERDTAGVCAAAARHRASLKNPPKSAEEYLAFLEKAGLKQSTATLRTMTDLM